MRHLHVLIISICILFTGIILLGCSDVDPFSEISPLEIIAIEVPQAIVKPDIQALRAEVIDRAEKFPDTNQSASGQFTIFNGITNPQTVQPIVWPDLITEGVIEDYVNIIQFMDERATMVDQLRQPNEADTRDYADIFAHKNSKIIFHQRDPRYGRGPLVMTTPGQDP